MNGAMSAFGPKQTSATAPHMSAFGGKADMTVCGNPLSRSLLGAKRTCPFAKRTCAPRLLTAPDACTVQHGAVPINLGEAQMQVHELVARFAAAVETADRCSPEKRKTHCIAARTAGYAEWAR
jgi:hypothetical protein